MYLVELPAASVRSGNDGSKGGGVNAAEGPAQAEKDTACVCLMSMARVIGAA